MAVNKKLKVALAAQKIIRAELKKHDKAVERLQKARKKLSAAAEKVDAKVFALQDV